MFLFHQWTCAKWGYKGATMVSLPDCWLTLAGYNTCYLVVTMGLSSVNYPFDYVEADWSRPRYSKHWPPFCHDRSGPLAYPATESPVLNQGPPPVTIARPRLRFVACDRVFGSKVQHGGQLALWLMAEGCGFVHKWWQPAVLGHHDTPLLDKSSICKCTYTWKLSYTFIAKKLNAKGKTMSF